MLLPSRLYKIVKVNFTNPSRYKDDVEDDEELLYVLCDAVDIDKQPLSFERNVMQTLDSETRMNLPEGAVIQLIDRIMFPIDLEGTNYFIEGDYIRMHDNGILRYKNRVYPSSVKYDLHTH